MKNRLIILRGIPGCGKTSFAELLQYLAPDMVSIHCADDFFLDKRGEYCFDMARIGEAHQWCQRQVESDLDFEVPVVVVHNTTTTNKELKPYLDLAAKYDYQVVSLVVENRHGGTNVHEVPEETLGKMRNRFVVQL